MRETAEVRKISVPSLTPTLSKIVTHGAACNVTAILSLQTTYLAPRIMILLLGHNDQIFFPTPCDNLIICSQLYFLLKGTSKL